MLLSDRAPVAIVIPVYNAMDHLPRALEVIRGLRGPPCMAVVVDDASTDGTAEFLDNAPEVITLRGSGSLWWSGGANVGCRHAIDRGATTLILWNDDNVAASENCLVDLIDAVERHRGCASPVILREHVDGSRRIVSAGGSVRWRDGGLSLRDAGEPYVARAEPETCDWLSGNVLAFPSQLYEALGGFDADRFPQYRGDSDFTLRAKGLGRPNLALYSCWVINDISRSGLNFWTRVSPRRYVEGLFTRKSSYELRSTFRFYLRHCPPATVPFSLAIFYLKYTYATVKSWIRRAH